MARAAGVSLVTASRALKKPELVSPATIEKVLRAVEKTGYIPNLMAGGLKSNQAASTIAALVPYIAVPQFLPTLQALTETLDQAGYQLILGQTGYNRVRENALLNTMITRRVDGIVFAGLLSPDAPLAQLTRLGIPVVETWDLTARPLDMLVGFSHTQVGSSVGGFFLKRGWRKVGVATADDERAMQRCQGFLSVMGDRRAGLESESAQHAGSRAPCARGIAETRTETGSRLLLIRWHGQWPAHRGTRTWTARAGRFGRVRIW